MYPYLLELLKFIVSISNLRFLTASRIALFLSYRSIESKYLIYLEEWHCLSYSFAAHEYFVLELGCLKMICCLGWYFTPLMELSPSKLEIHWYINSSWLMKLMEEKTDHLISSYHRLLRFGYRRLAYTSRCFTNSQP